MDRQTERKLAAYFHRPPDADFIEVGDDFVLACRIEDRPAPEWQKLVPKIDGKLAARVLIDQGSRARHGVHGFGDIDFVPADPPIEAMSEKPRIFYALGIDGKLRGDRGAWLKRAAETRYAERVDKARKFHFRMIDEKPSDFLTKEDRATFIQLAKEAMAAICHLTTFLPQTEIMAPGWATRLLEMVERKMVELENYGMANNELIAAEKRARGSQGVEEIDDQKIEKLQRRRQGLLFQYYHCQLLFAAWREQYDDVTLEHDTLAQALRGHDRAMSPEFEVLDNADARKTTGRPTGQPGYRDYVRLRDRVAKRKRDEKDKESAVLKQLQMMETKSEQEYRRWLLQRTTYKPKHGQPSLAGRAGNDVAQPMSEFEVDGSRPGFDE